jgi:replicative DNA helicase
MLQETAARLRNECTPKKVDVHIADAMERVWGDYCGAEKGERVSVFPWPWPPLQEATLGVRSTDYIIFYGRPKSMKSWILCYVAATIINASADYRLLIYSKEMDADEIFERIGCLLAGVSYENFVGARLTPEERANFAIVLSFLDCMRLQQVVVCLSAQDVKQGQDTVAWLESKVEKYQPHAIFVDGMYLMSDASGSKKNNERVASVSRAMRQLVLRKKIPVIATVQANREAAKNEEANTEEVAFSDSLAQDATMLIRIVNEWKKGANTLALVMGGASRRYKLRGLRIYGMPAVNFGYYGELSEKEAEAALKVDAASSEAKGAKPARALTKKKDAAEVNKAAADVAGLISHA